MTRDDEDTREGDQPEETPPAGADDEDEDLILNGAVALLPIFMRRRSRK